ncbi:hypothetical protein ACIQPQ_31565 [Streptomyces sp. NPDC091281]|uniref:hypothetical protein n=1 Tax=Streptomyces sp. NPDC091281 TaxID=3365985 RepID=UPI0038054D23
MSMFRGPGRRRAVDEVERLRIREAAADDFIAFISGQLTLVSGELTDERERRTTAEAELEQAEKAIRLRDEEIARLKRTAAVRAHAENVVTATQELDVRSLRARFADGPVRSLHHSPQAHVPAWARAL